MTLEHAMRHGDADARAQAGRQKITGTYTGRYGESQLKGTLKGRDARVCVHDDAEGQSATMSFRGEVAADGQSMKGDATLEGLGDATWTATRKQNDKTQ